MEFFGIVNKKAQNEYYRFFILNKLIFSSVALMFLLIISIIGNSLNRSTQYTVGIVFVVVFFVFIIAIGIYGYFVIKKLFDTIGKFDNYKVRIEKDKIYYKTYLGENLIEEKEFLNIYVFRVFETHSSYIFIFDNKKFFILEKQSKAKNSEETLYLQSIYENRFEPLHKKRLLKRR